MTLDLGRTPRVAVVGGGPIGLEAALFAIEAGFDCSVYERGRVAENVRRWGHVRLFTPFSLNASDWGREALAACPSAPELPTDDALLSGSEFAERYVVPLSRLPQLANRIHEQTAVLAIGRSRTWKRDLIGDARRGLDPFRLLIRGPRGESTVEVDFVLDCSGTFPNHNWCGAGGTPAIGERQSADGIEYGLPDLLGSDRAQYVGRSTLVVGSGYSAATAVVALSRLAELDPRTRVVWITRSEQSPPLSRLTADPLADRDALAARANQLALASEGFLQWRPSTVIREILPIAGEEGFRVRCNGVGGQATEFAVDRIIANVGYRPDRNLYEELQVHECYASQGPIRLAAALLGETSADCLAVQGFRGDTLVNPEPGFFILGSKSYGRDSRFLLKVGFEQISEAFALIARTGAPV